MFIRWLSRILFSRIRLAFGGNAGSFQNVTNGNDRPYQYRFSSNRPKRDTIQSAVQSFSRGMHCRRITLYYRSYAYCDVIKSQRHKREGKRPQVIENALRCAHVRRTPLYFTCIIAHFTGGESYKQL